MPVMDIELRQRGGLGNGDKHVSPVEAERFYRVKRAVNVLLHHELAEVEAASQRVAVIFPQLADPLPHGVN